VFGKRLVHAGAHEIFGGGEESNTLLDEAVNALETDRAFADTTKSVPTIALHRELPTERFDVNNVVFANVEGIHREVRALRGNLVRNGLGGLDDELLGHIESLGCLIYQRTI
jgi:hypothetical protein